MQHIDDAVDFFGEMSERYKDSNAVLYEICNEPNGNVTWNDNVKPYAETVIPVIRANTNAIILVEVRHGVRICMRLQKIRLMPKI